MKFNLKNRPQAIGIDKLHFSAPIEEWFEGFEKELREIQADQLKRFGIPNAYIGIKEILGE